MAPLAKPSASSRPRTQRKSTQPVHFLSAASSRQHPAKTNTGIPNADAVSEGTWHLGICDGVSGVFHLGISPDEFPQDLLGRCGKLLSSRLEDLAFGPDQGPSGSIDHGTWLTTLVQEAYDATKVQGATTLLLTALRDQNLVTACIGDSALLVLRPTNKQPLRLRTIFKTEPGRYDARRPLQVQRLQGVSEMKVHNVIKAAMVSTTAVQPGDLLILGSDGLFDNLSDNDMRMVLERICTPSGDVNAAGTSVAEVHHLVMDQLKRAAAALVELAISRVRLNQQLDLEDGMTPRQKQPGEVPANNADDTTALVAVVMQDRAMVSAAHEEAEAVPAERSRADLSGASAAPVASVSRGQVVSIRAPFVPVAASLVPSEGQNQLLPSATRVQWPQGLKEWQAPAVRGYPMHREPCSRITNRDACKKPEDCVIS